MTTFYDYTSSPNFSSSISFHLFLLVMITFFISSLLILMLVLLLAFFLLFLSPLTGKQLAKALRKGPYQTNLLLAGFDANEGETA